MSTKWFCCRDNNFITLRSVSRFRNKVIFCEQNEAKSGQDPCSPGAHKDSAGLDEDSNQREDSEDPGPKEADQPRRGGEGPRGGVLQTQAGGGGQQLRQDRVGHHGPAGSALIQQILCFWERASVRI